MDGSNIYGVSCQEAETVRDRQGNLGLLRVVPLPVARSDRMPISPPADPGSFCRSPRPSVKPCFLFADFRDNENPSMYHMYNMLKQIQRLCVLLISQYDVTGVNHLNYSEQQPPMQTWLARLVTQSIFPNKFSVIWEECVTRLTSS